ncbi:MAG: Holliday junction resolvase RuvX [Bacillota bacterium]
MRILALDIGDKRIGVAISDPFGWTAQPLETIIRKNLSLDIQRIQDLARKYEVTELLLGLPKNMNGTLGPQAIKVQELAKVLGRDLALPVAFWDERLSTVAAQRVLLEADTSRSKRKLVIDKMAAVLILQGYLDYRSSKSKMDPTT